MKRRLMAAACGFALILVAGACKKKEEKPVVPLTGMPGQMQPAMPGQMQPGQMPPGQALMPKGETVVTVPDSVKGKWKAVVLVVEDKTAKKMKDYTVNINSDLKIPDSNLKISVGEFLPDFKMDGLTLTSMSNEPNNPAVRIKIFENDKEIFKGMLFLKFPTIHPFEHPKYSVLLKNGIKKG
jgi:hypothetical protein